MEEEEDAVEKKIDSSLPRKEMEKTLNGRERKLAVAEPELALAIAEIRSLEKELKKLEQAIYDKKNHLCLLLADITEVIDTTGKTLCTYVGSVQTRFNSQILKKRHPQLYQLCMVEMEIRTLRINK
jgi:hypothetical protein